MIELLTFAPLQLDKRLLHDVPRPVAIAKDAGSVLQEREFKATN
jgi:hypothetical protein